jgi:hypothetical protein
MSFEKPVPGESVYHIAWITIIRMVKPLRLVIIIEHVAPSAALPSIKPHIYIIRVF